MKTVKGTPQEPIQYKASITREQFMFYEMRTTAKLLMEGLTDAEAVKRIISENLFQYPTEKQIRSQALACIKRLHGMNDESVTVIGEKYRNRDMSFGRRDLNVYFIRLQEQIDSVAAWSDTTVAKAKQVLLRVLVENEYLDATEADHLNPVWLDSQLENAIRANHDEAMLPAFNCLD